jgi:hypothetical protein
MQDDGDRGRAAHRRVHAPLLAKRVHVGRCRLSKGRTRSMMWRRFRTEPAYWPLPAGAGAPPVTGPTPPGLEPLGC